MKTRCSVLLFAAIPCVAVLAQNPRSVWEGVYTRTQAERGEELYKRACSYCHRDDLRGGFIDDGVGNAPPLAGARAFGSSFAERWTGLTLGEMVATIAGSMPKDKPSSLSVQEYVDLVAFLLSKNDVPAGESEVPVDIEALGAILITRR